jgi:hypothetical protein
MAELAEKRGENPAKKSAKMAEIGAFSKAQSAISPSFEPSAPDRNP